VVHEDSTQPLQLVLQGSWLSTPAAVGMRLNVLAPRTETGWTVDDAVGLVVLHPDVLVAGTRVADSVYCLRRSVLDEKIRVCDCTCCLCVARRQSFGRRVRRARVRHRA
jgi:DNA replication ATP-dependent helicase Dna2